MTFLAFAYLLLRDQNRDANTPEPLIILCAAAVDLVSLGFVVSHIARAL